MRIDLNKKSAIPGCIRWQIRPVNRILFVVEDQTTADCSNNPGIAKLRESLETETNYAGVNCLITLACRAGTQGIYIPDTFQQFTYTGFSFNMPGFDIYDYDQVWFLGSYYGDGEDPAAPEFDKITRPVELRILEKWMNSSQSGTAGCIKQYQPGTTNGDAIPYFYKMAKWSTVAIVPAGTRIKKGEKSADSFSGYEEMPGKPGQRANAHKHAH